MYWAGGCPGHVSRSGKPYAGATRWLDARSLDVKPPKPPIDWWTVLWFVVGMTGFFAGLFGLIIMMMLML